MRRASGRWALLTAAAVLMNLGVVSLGAGDPLPTWRDTAPRQSLLAFVERVTQEGSPDYVPVSERVAVFDNDGTLWAEQPIYVQLRFALDRVKALAPEHPEWRHQQPFKKLLATPQEETVAVTEHELLEIMMASHANMTTDVFERTVRDWLETAEHPRFRRPYTELVYQPMLELLDYLRAKGFRTYIVSGGGVEFMRVFSEKVYGIPPEQVVGSTIQTRYEVRQGEPVIVRLPEVDFIDDGDGKPVGIHKFIGRRPLAAFGNSDGDLSMLQWTAARPGASFCLYVHHTDADREWAYDRDSSVGRLEEGLREARARGWTVVSMRDDWKQIFPSSDR